MNYISPDMLKPKKFKSYFKFFKIDLDNKYINIRLLTIRLIMACIFVKSNFETDYYYMTTEPAYKLVYGNNIYLPEKIHMPWEWHS